MWQLAYYMLKICGKYIGIKNMWQLYIENCAYSLFASCFFEGNWLTPFGAFSAGWSPVGKRAMLHMEC